jgi:hypothetical protein
MLPSPASPECLAGLASQILEWTRTSAEPLLTLRRSGFAFALPEDMLWRTIGRGFDDFRSKGAYLFECQYSRKLGLLPTSDPWEVVASMGTRADNFDLATKQIITWLKAFDAAQPFQIIGAGHDFVRARFITEIKNSRKLARRIFEFCPDAVYENSGTLAALALSLKRRKEFLLWWD